jgi:aminoglycoside phosphotransferase (APT) family kinase protein
VSAEPEKKRSPAHAVGDRLLDLPALARWLGAQGLITTDSLSVSRLTSGRSNAMFRLDHGPHRWVLRRPPAVAVERSDELMRREFRLLSALDHTGVPHPRTVALCDDPGVLGCTFYVMEAVDGFNPIGPLPEALHSREHEVADAMVDALSALHEVDWRALDLKDFGRPDGFHERQVARWTKQLDSYGGRALPGLERVGRWLGEHLPGEFEPTIMHGDYHMLNVIVAGDLPARVAAIVDWETASIGDPLLDAVGFVEVWCPSHPTGDGWPDREHLLRRYASTRGIGELRSTEYYIALYHFRLAVLLEGIYQRSLVDPTRPPATDVGERVLIEVALAVAAVDGAAAPCRSGSRQDAAEAARLSSQAGTRSVEDSK